MNSICPRCGCPAYRRTGSYWTVKDDLDPDTGRFTGDPTGRLARCVKCSLQLQMLPGEGIVGTYPPGPFDREGVPA